MDIEENMLVKKQEKPKRSKDKGKEEIFNELSDKFHNFLNGIGNQIDIDLLSISDPIKPTIEWIINLKDQKTEADVQRESVSNELKDLLDNLQLSTPADIEKKMAKLQMEVSNKLISSQKELLQEALRLVGN